ncbi:MAG TPA: hypothetical protein DIS79_07230 [Bacteroidetes bacterium]|nr:hypothetical protein [Bacteroidota bacterium]
MASKRKLTIICTFCTKQFFTIFTRGDRMKRLLLSLTAATLFAGCSSTNDPHDHDDDHDHDIITTVTVTFLNIADLSAEPVVAVWEDIDGPGGANPNRIDTIRLVPGTSYRASITVQNMSVTPPVDLTETIRNEKENHQFFYTAPSGMVTITYADADSRSLPVGLSFGVLAATSPSPDMGTLNVALSHYDNAADKNGMDRSDETDISVDFPIVVR